MGIFKRGYSVVKEEVVRQEVAKEHASKRLWRFFLDGKKGNTEAEIQFLTEEPVNFQEHQIKTLKNGKEFFESFTCTQDDSCPYCSDGDKSQFKGAYLVYDRRPFEKTDPKTNKKVTVEGQVRLYAVGTRVLSQLDRMSSKYGLTKYLYNIVRTGTGTATAYNVERCDPVPKMTAAEIKNILPEKLREAYDGSVDSLYSIVEEQLKLSLPSSQISENDEDEDSPVKDNTLVSAEDDAPVEAPKKTGGLPFKSKLKPPVHNSVKKFFKK